MAFVANDRFTAWACEAGQIGNGRIPPNAEIQTETQPDSRGDLHFC
jgi:hypothetical protein